MEQQLFAHGDLLESLAEQSAFLQALDLDVKCANGERIRTENSYKYTDAMINSILRESGFALWHTWSDRKKWFGRPLGASAINPTFSLPRQRQRGAAIQLRPGYLNLS